MGKKKEPESAKVAPVSIETLVDGDGARIPKKGDLVTVHYIGTLASDGKMFDSSREKKQPFTFRLGSGDVIKGWDLGVAQMSIGQRAKLSIAAHAAYGAKGCEDKANASGTGVIPPDADLLFDVEVLDINHSIVLSTYQKTLDEWQHSKLQKFDDDAELRVTLESKHGGRGGYERYLKGVVTTKFEAECSKRGVPVPSTTSASNLDATTNGIAAVSLGKQPAEDNGEPKRVSLQFDARFATFKVEPNDDGEGKSPNFPRNLHNAAELFVHLQHKESAERLHSCVRRCLTTLEAGPDGKSGQRLGRACICWACGHVGLPRNASECRDKGPKPAGVCANCGDAGQTNFVKGVGKDGKVLPWIEAAPLSQEQVAKAAEACAAAEVAEVS